MLCVVVGVPRVPARGLYARNYDTGELRIANMHRPRIYSFKHGERFQSVVDATAYHLAKVRCPSLHNSLRHDRNNETMAGRNRILGDDLGRWWTVEDYVIVRFIQMVILNPTANERTLVPLGMYGIALLGCGQFDLNVI